MKKTQFLFGPFGQLLFLFLFIILAISCKSGVESPSSDKNLVFRTHLDSLPRPSDTLNLDHFISYGQSHFVALEETDESLLRYGQKIKIMDSSIYVRDFDMNMVLRFDLHSGKYINTLGKEGKGANEIVQLNDFCTDHERGIVWLSSGYPAQILPVQADGTIIESDIINLPSLKSYNDIEVFGQQLIGVRSAAGYREGKMVDVLELASGKVIDSFLNPLYLEKDYKYFSGQNPVSIHKSPDGIYVTGLMNDTVYKYSNKKISPHFLLLLGEMKPDWDWLRENMPDIHNIPKNDISLGIYRLHGINSSFFVTYLIHAGQSNEYPGSLLSGSGIVNIKYNMALNTRYFIPTVKNPIGVGGHFTDTYMVHIIGSMNGRQNTLHNLNWKKENVPDLWTDEFESIRVSIISHIEKYPDFANPCFIITKLKPL